MSTLCPTTPPVEWQPALLPPVETVDQLGPETLPAFIAACAALQARAASRLLANVPASTPLPEEPERLLTVPETAAQLRFAPSYVYELVRQGVLISVRRGRYVRIAPVAIAAFIAAHEQRLATPLSDTLVAGRVRQETPRASHSARFQADRARGRTRSASDHGVEVGDRRPRSPRASGEAPATPRKDGTH